MPAFGSLLHLCSLGQVGRSDFVRRFEFAEGERKALADAVVVYRENVGTTEPEDEHHLDGPATDAAYLCEVFDDGLVGHAADLCKSRYGAVDSLGSKVAQSERLVVREACTTELFVGTVEQMFG